MSKSKVTETPDTPQRSIALDFLKAKDKILFLENQVLEAERTIEVLIAAGFVSASTVEEARNLVQSVIWRS